MKTVYTWRASWAFAHHIHGGRVVTSSDGGPYAEFDNCHQALENAIEDKPRSRTLISKKIKQHEVADDTRTIEDLWAKRKEEALP